MNSKHDDVINIRTMYKENIFGGRTNNIYTLKPKRWRIRLLKVLCALYHLNFILNTYELYTILLHKNHLGGITFITFLNKLPVIYTRMAEFQENLIQVSSAKDNDLWLPRKCDNRTDRH